jgi:hypothetical protein
MTTLASTLLDFILDLFRDDDAARAFEDDPHRALAAAGLDDVDPADVHALMPMVADSSPACGSRAGDDNDDDGRWHRAWNDDDRRDHDGRPSHDYAGHGHDAAVIHNVRYVENSYSHTQGDTNVDVDVENGIWAGGDVEAIFGDDNVVATDGSVAAGDDVEDVSVENTDVDIRDSGNTNSGNENTNIADRGGEITDVDVDDVTVVNDSFNGADIAGRDVDNSTNVDVEDSLNGNQIAGDDVNDTDVDVEDSFNDETDVDVEDSFNEDDSTNVAVDLEDSFNEDESTNVDVDLEDSLNENALGLANNTGEIDD